MATGFNRDPDAVGWCPPYSGRVSSPRDVEPRFLDSPHLTLLLVNEEHLRAILTGERLVTSPPTDSPLHAWLSTGDPEAYCGPLVISWVFFFKHMTLRDEEGHYTYNPLFFARVVSPGQSPFVIQHHYGVARLWPDRPPYPCAVSAGFPSGAWSFRSSSFSGLGVRVPHDGGRPPHALFARLSLSLGVLCLVAPHPWI